MSEKWLRGDGCGKREKQHSHGSECRVLGLGPRAVNHRMRLLQIMLEQTVHSLPLSFRHDVGLRCPPAGEKICVLIPYSPLTSFLSSVFCCCSCRSCGSSSDASLHDIFLSALHPQHRRRSAVGRFLVQ